MHRKEFYSSQIKKFFPKLLTLQDIRKNSDTYGCFDLPYWEGEIDFPNARWQEAVAAISWLYLKKKDRILGKRIEGGISFWKSLQNKDGSFPEYNKRDRSFSATAFSSLAVALAIRLTNNNEEEWLDALYKAGKWLAKNNEHIYLNQQAAASLALLYIYYLTKEEKFLDESEKKLNEILRNQTEDGYYPEKKGLDLSYSSLTLALLGNYYVNVKDRRIINSAKKFISFASHFIFPDGSFGGYYNTRTVGWLILDGFEIFSKSIPLSNFLLEKITKAHVEQICRIEHLPDNRHLCTDLIWLCLAYDHCKNKFQMPVVDFPERKIFNASNIKIIRNRNYIIITDMSEERLFSLWTTNGFRIFVNPFEREEKKVSPLIRRFGVHKLRRFKYLKFKKFTTPLKISMLSNERVVLTGDKIILATRPNELSISGNNFNMLRLSSKDGYIVIKIEDGDLSYLDRGVISVSDSIFYGDKALHFIEVFSVDKKNINFHLII